MLMLAGFDTVLTIDYLQPYHHYRAYDYHDLWSIVYN